MRKYVESLLAQLRLETCLTISGPVVNLNGFQFQQASLLIAIPFAVVVQLFTVTSR